MTIDGPNGRLLGNGGATADRKNNVETGRLENSTLGTYIITVVQVNTGSTAGPTIGIIGQLFLPLVQR